MNKQVRCYCSVAAVLLIALSGAGTSAAQNTKLGTGALASDTSGADDTALGYYALFSNMKGNYNTATGLHSLRQNTSASYNTATGVNSLRYNTTGLQNTATGLDALFGNISGADNTASGFQALDKSDGDQNTATGVSALYNSGLLGNTATGLMALFNNSNFGNTADGAKALFSDTTLSLNTASGFEALYANTAASGDCDIAPCNIGLGYQAGANLTNGIFDIYIGNAGAATESNTTRIGYPNLQSATYIAGISGAAVVGSDVVVSGSGQLGVVMSSARFKRDIRSMGEASNDLMKLRPVTFRYKNDPSGARRYGLVAEEVQRVYPELVTYGADGKVETVRYSMLNAMLLNELQKQARMVEDHTRELRNQVEVLQEQTRENRRLAQRGAKLSTQMVATKTSTGREIAEFRAGYEGDLQSIQQRLAAMEQAIADHERRGDAGRGGTVE
jgi:trimeric autotransporter adhesin